MIQCLQVAKAEYEYEAERYTHECAEDYDWLNKHHITNKALIRENLRNVARIGNSVVPIMAEKLVEANCPYLKVGERVPNLIIDDTQEQLRFA